MRLAHLCFARLAASILAFAAAAIAPLSVAAAIPPAQDSGVLVDARFGFKLRPPKEWSKIPPKLQEPWLLAQYLSDKSYYYNDKASGSSWEHKPELLVIAFLSEAARKRTEANAAPQDANEKLKLLLANPAKDYLDYFKRAYSDGGYRVSDPKEAKVEDLAVTQYQIDVPKLTRTGPRRIVCWVFHTPDVDFAVQCDTLEDAWSKLEKPVTATLRSFRTVARTDGDPTNASAGSVPAVDDPSAGTPAERRIQRKAQETKLREQAKATAPQGWQVFESGRFLVITHTDEKYSRRLAEQCEAVLSWLEQTFPFVGPEEFVRGPILRICADSKEEQSLRKAGDGFWFSDQDIEIVTYQDQLGFGRESSTIDRGNQQVLSLWFSERDRDMWRAMPSWLKGGLFGVVGNARSKGDKLELKPDEWEHDELRERSRLGKSSAPRELMKTSFGDYSSSLEWWSRSYEVAALVRFFVTGPAAKNPRTKDVLREYIKNLHAVILEIQAEPVAAPEDADADEPEPASDEEQDPFKRERKFWKKHEQRLLDAAFERTFRSWTDKDWKDFEDVYVKSANSSR